MIGNPYRNEIIQNITQISGVETAQTSTNGSYQKAANRSLAFNTLSKPLNNYNNWIISVDERNTQGNSRLNTNDYLVSTIIKNKILVCLYNTSGQTMVYNGNDSYLQKTGQTYSVLITTSINNRTITLSAKQADNTNESYWTEHVMFLYPVADSQLNQSSYGTYITYYTIWAW